MISYRGLPRYAPSHEFSPSPVYITCTGNQQKVLFKGHYSKHSLNLPIVLCTSAWFCSTPDTGANRTKRRLTHLSVSHFEIEFRHFEHQSVANPTGRSPSSIMGVEVEVEDEHDICKPLAVQFRRCEGYPAPLPQCLSLFPAIGLLQPCQHQHATRPPCTFHQSGLRALDCMYVMRMSGATTG